MEHAKLQQYSLLVILGGLCILSFFILRPFMYVIILALVSAIFFEPVHQKMLRLLAKQPTLAALATTLVIIIILLIPFVFLGIRIFQEAEQFFTIIGSEKDAFANMLNTLVANLQSYIPLQQPFSIDLEQYVREWSAWLISHFAYLFGSVTKLVFSFFMFIITTYFVLKDGPKLKKILMNLSPLANRDDQLIFNKMKIAIHSVIKGSLVIAVVQGVLVSIGFALFGVPNATLWGIVATISSLIPGIGTAIVSIPAIVFLFLKGNLLMTLGLLVWSIVIVGLIDNFLKPILIGKELRIHPLIIFFAAIGGIIFFGPIGFLLGPLTISLLFALLDIHLALKHETLA